MVLYLDAMTYKISFDWKYEIPRWKRWIEHQSALDQQQLSISEAWVCIPPLPPKMSYCKLPGLLHFYRIEALLRWCILYTTGQIWHRWGFLLSSWVMLSAPNTVWFGVCEVTVCDNIGVTKTVACLKDIKMSICWWRLENILTGHPWVSEIVFCHFLRMIHTQTITWNSVGIFINVTEDIVL